MSDYLQAFVTRREHVNEIISTFNLDKSLIQAAKAVSEAAAVVATAVEEEEGATTSAPEQDAISIPEITCKTKDAAIRDIVLSCFRYDTLFTLYHHRQAREAGKKDAGNQKQKPAPATSTSMFSSNFGDNTKLLDDDDLAMDLDKESEEELELKADLDLLKSQAGAAVLSVQIHLIYEDSHSTTPTKADVRFSKGRDLIQIDSLPRRHPLREQHAKWINSLTTNYSLYDAILSIADLHKP